MIITVKSDDFKKDTVAIINELITQPPGRILRKIF